MFDDWALRGLQLGKANYRDKLVAAQRIGWAQAAPLLAALASANDMDDEARVLEAAVSARALVHGIEDVKHAAPGARQPFDVDAASANGSAVMDFVLLSRGRDCNASLAQPQRESAPAISRHWCRRCAMIAFWTIRTQRPCPDAHAARDSWASACDA